MQNKKIQMIGKMRIVGFKEPVELTEEEAKKIAELKADANVSPRAAISVGNWTGEKGEIRAVWTEKFVPERDYSKPSFSASDLAALEKELKPYFLKKTDAEYGDKVKQMMRVLTASDLKSYELMWSPAMLADINTVRKQTLTEEEAKTEAERIIDKYLVGKLTAKAEQRFLVDKKAIGVYSDGMYAGEEYVRRGRDGSISYLDISPLLTAWHDMNSRKEYAKQQELKQLEELAASMSVDHED